MYCVVMASFVIVGPSVIYTHQLRLHTLYGSKSAVEYIELTVIYKAKSKSTLVVIPISGLLLYQ